ncbi:hypothetical protein A2130_04295 [Candidatus Woesebacteria bacterium GWC2_33_12]|uniref:Uncharacterized protein n=1 Tax=Candidatus Woesebacteria bacterium GW2011_GWB1_33_22 TaxID=1618566 RepID=A0A0G0BZG7_9BACT|nr:MAG: hypothetical protein UR29_C0015G0011 [Candidatus Woesebacteria bacterium GW2011_GWC2_33_12]KKP41836.1 MAG: hypothetical protein UR33_C0009G0030 [Candidatus Woesebacteria bacterium GW2011_GWA2_33_20]KKP44305.1 MAG: hypothetical protein UR35_C0009G0016 [Candidatus Woesebacteria bacterium GW2011_GWB1_33_22]KKP46063.1 MAG: hypothetical protein UR37_C0012G0015 [Microgenomates group bacterium GW2011_GWC1_33_28]KKP49952.1 MAG: hypothetical protein UR41_C0011G0014 [Candidatus Woesebacteria bact
MKNIIENFKKRKFIILGIISLVSIVFIVFKTKTKPVITNPTPTPFTSSQIADFNSIVPNQTSLERINELLGYPVETKNENGITINEYRTTNKYRTHVIKIENGIATFIKQEIISGEQKTSDIQNVYGVAPNVLYSQAPNASFDLFVYPANGIAYLGHSDGTILEIWYFPPVENIDMFIENYGQGYGKEPSKVIPLY